MPLSVTPLCRRWRWKMDASAHLDGFQVLVSQHQLLFQLHDFAHGLVLHVLQLLCHLQRPEQRQAERVMPLKLSGGLWSTRAVFFLYYLAINPSAVLEWLNQMT